jgi:hypothetical protein
MPRNALSGTEQKDCATNLVGQGRAVLLLVMNVNEIVA